jgi:hypothetical protein
MKTSLLFARLLVTVPVLIFLTASAALGQLQWRISVKFILDANGNMPAGGNMTTLAAVTNEIATANQILDGTGRGYRFQLIEILALINVSQWFNVDVFANKTALESAAESNPTTYAWRTTAINVYINGNPTNSAVCSFPSTGDDVIFVGQNSLLPVLIHEVGHFHNLYHTQGQFCAGCTGAGACTSPGDDLIADTLPDVACWTQNQIAMNAFGAAYTNLNSAQQRQVDDVFFNVMSYHPTLNRFTSDQLDRLTDASNGTRINVATGRTWFVDRNNTCIFPNGDSGCVLGGGGPFKTVAAGISAASTGDIVLLRPGKYNEPMTITKPVTLRATRGRATIGQ